MPHFTASDGANIYFEDRDAIQPGPQIPLLCLSGLARNARDFDFVARHLPNIRMIRMDYRGRGQSDWTGADSYTIPREAADVTELLDHLGLTKGAILGTSRGGLLALFLAATAKERLGGVAFNDMGPVVETGGLDAIMTYLGKKPGYADFDAAAQARMGAMAGFANVPLERWRQEVTHTHVETDQGLDINYDPALRDAVAAARAAPAPDLWPLFDLLADLPVAVIRGANSDILSLGTVEKMAQRHPGLITAEVPDRGHVPFLDEPQALQALTEWAEALP
jgi:pimeloyl-ACP methyl ester carboxylesterase